MSDFHSSAAQDLRADIDAAISAGHPQKAFGLLSGLWRQAPGPSTAGFVLSRFERLHEHVSPTPCRLALLRSCTLEPVVPLLRAGAATWRLDLEVLVGGFNTYAQELLDGASALYAYDPAIVILAVQAQDVAPDLWTNFADLEPAEVNAAIRRVLDSFQRWVGALRSRSRAHLVLQTLEIPEIVRYGIYDAQCGNGQAEAVRSINRGLADLARERSGVYLLDYDALVGRYGRLRWRDERKWLAYRMPVSAECLPFLAHEYLRFVVALTGKGCKALVVDLDNTLWGGVIGEDGMEALEIGPNYPGAAYLELQRAVLDLYRRGVLLAVCSRNNESDALEVLEHHPQMLLRPHHFASLRINWDDKARNLREIAAELNIGTDALAFLDDSPTERAWVQNQIPDVTVIELPRDPMDYARALRDSPVFDRVALTDEDRDRCRYYADERLRRNLQEEAGSLEDFQKSLETRAQVAFVSPAAAGRVAQLTQKTNQFNLTTRRYSEQQILEMANDSSFRVYSIRAADCFGDSGIVGAAITRFDGEGCEIEEFLLSCRVLSRGLETSLLAVLAENARSAGLRKLVGWFLPTKKNIVAREFYAQHGFTRVLEEGGASCWQFDLQTATIASPPWIKLEF